MVLRNVAKTFSLEEQRQEINEIAADLDSLDTTVSNLNFGNTSNWDAAYSWGDHALAGYWVDVPADRTNWDTAYSWGDHAAAGYLTSYTETDTLLSVTNRGNNTDQFISFSSGKGISMDTASNNPFEIYGSSNQKAYIVHAQNNGAGGAGDLVVIAKNGLHVYGGTSELAANLGFEVVSGYSKLLYQGNTKLETTATGVDITGTLDTDVISVSSELRFNDGSNFVGISAPAGLSANYTLTLPDNDGTGAGQVLSTDGSGNLSWVSTGAGDLVNGTLAATIYRSSGEFRLIAGGAQSTRPHIHLKNSTTSDLEILGADGDSAGVTIDSRGTGTVKLKDGGATKLETSDTGVTVLGVISADNGNSSDWNAAYGWGDHSSAGYLTAEADTLDSVTDRGATTDNSVTVGDFSANGLSVSDNLLTLGNSSNTFTINFSQSTGSSPRILNSITESGLQIQGAYNFGGTFSEDIFLGTSGVASRFKHLVPQTDLTYDLGSSTKKWDNIYAGKLYYSNNFADLASLPSATDYHGMFAHVHAEGHGYFAHAGGWWQLLDTTSSLGELGDVNLSTAPNANDVLAWDGSNWAPSASAGGGSGSGTLSVTTSNAGKAYVDAVPGTFTAYGVNLNDVEQNTPTYTNTDGTTTVPVTNPANHPDPVSLAFDGREDTYVDVTSTVDGGVVELVFTNPVAEFNLTRLILGFDGNIECGFNGGNYVTASGATGSITELTVTSAGSQTLDKLSFRTPTASSGVGKLYYVIASYPNGWVGGTNSRLTIKQTDISVGSSGTGDNQLIMHDSSPVIQLTPSDVNKVVAVKTDISREIILPAGTLMTPGDTVTVIDVGYGALDRNDTNNYPQATGAGFPYMTYNSGNAQYAPIKIYPSRDEGIQGTNIQPWNQPNSISNYTQSQTNTGYYVPEPFHGMPFAIKRNGGSIKLMWIGPAYGWRILP